MTDNIDELIKDVQDYKKFHQQNYKGSDLDTAKLLGRINKELLKAKKYREALEKISGANDMDGNSMECDTHEECQHTAKQALAKITN